MRVYSAAELERLCASYDKIESHEEGYDFCQNVFHDLVGQIQDLKAKLGVVEPDDPDEEMCSL